VRVLQFSSCLFIANTWREEIRNLKFEIGKRRKKKLRGICGRRPRVSGGLILQGGRRMPALRSTQGK
jgi:hypothetical protein